MDNNALDEMLENGRERRFWLKPVGPPRDTPEWGHEEHRTWPESEIAIHFAKNPVRVAVGAILIAYRIRYRKIIYVAERLPVDQWKMAPETLSEYWRRRFPYFIQGRNLTANYGTVARPSTLFARCRV